MALRRIIIPFSLGFFALDAQFVLFRAFLSIAGGHELAIGCFFATWLFWVAIGAMLGRLFAARQGVVAHFSWVLLAYPAAFIVQLFLLHHARELAAVPAYEILPLGRLTVLGFLLNAPLSLATGLLFTLACRWLAEGRYALPAVRVYALETLGGCVGGIAVTLLIAAGVSGETAALLGMALSLAGIADRRGSGLAGSVMLALVLIAAATGIGERWADGSARGDWARLLPPESYQGRFTTPQGAYLYGESSGQFVVMSGGETCETLPAEARASEIAALHLAQQPATASVLVIGPDSLGLCETFARFKQIQRVTWLHPDPAYPEALRRVLPAISRDAAVRIEMPGADPRAWLRASPGQYDLIVLNLPDVTSLSINRYATRECCVLLKQALTEKGLVSFRLSGGDNYLSGEGALLGASILTTLEEQFPRLALKPGGESWLMGSAGASLSSFARGLSKRFGQIEGAAEVYPPEALVTLYPADRIAFQMNAYRKTQTDTDPALLRNTDGQPKALLYALLITLRQMGAPSLLSCIHGLQDHGIRLALPPLAAYALLRGLFLLRGRRGKSNQRIFDGLMLVLTGGFVSMAVSILLMFQLQASHGTLFLHAGLASALFMLGAFIASVVLDAWLSRKPEPAPLVPLALLAMALLLFFQNRLPEAPGYAVFAGLFFAAGLCGGAFFPITAGRMSRAGMRPDAAGAFLETADHLGAAGGAAITGLVLLPLFGASPALSILALCLGVNLPPLFILRRNRIETDAFDRWRRPFAYTMTFIAIVLLAASWVITDALRLSGPRRFRDAAELMAHGAPITAAQAKGPDGAPFTYFEVAPAKDAPGGYIFNSRDFAPDVQGYAGPVFMAVYVARDGRLLDSHVLESSETSEYESRVDAWRNELKGRRLTGKDPLNGVDGVSGATFTSQAVIQILERASQAFAAAAPNVNTPFERAAAKQTALAKPGKEALCLAVFLGIAIAARRHPRPWTRRAILAATALTCGFALNLQYSMFHVAALLTGQQPGLGWTGAALLIFGVPVITLLFGNLYCGYICPFGALQELIGDFRPARFHTDPPKTVWRWGRALKFLILFVFVAVLAFTRDNASIEADPLVTVFRNLRAGQAAPLIIAALVLSLFYRRFWCRNLCPAGAFLALLNAVRLARRLFKPTRPHQCDLGVRSARDLDCLYCDRCRHENP